MSVKKIPIAIGIKPNQVATFTNKTIDGTQNTLRNIPTGALQFNTITINGSTIPLGGALDIQVEGGSAIIDTNTTYSVKASSISGGASVDLDAGGSGTGTDSINFIGAGNVTVTRLNASTIQIGDAGTLGGVALTASNTATLSNKTISGNANTITNISNTSLTTPYININGSNVYLGESVTIAGGGGDVTANSNTIFTNKTINGQNNILSNIPSSALVSPFIRINGTQVNLGANFNVSGLGDVTLTGTQDLSNKSLLAPTISSPKIYGTITAGEGSGNNGVAGQVLKSAGNGGNVYWGNETRTTASTLIFGSGLTSIGGSSFDGSNQVTLSINTGVVATLTGAQSLSNKTLVDPAITVSGSSLSLPSGPDTLVGRNSTDTLTNKTLASTTLTGTLTLSNGVGTAGQVLKVNSTGDGLEWGIGGGGGSGTISGPPNVSDNTIVRWDGSAGTLIQSSSITISDDGAIVAPSAGSIIPFYFDTLADLPSPSTYHGAIAHAHDTGRMYYAHGNEWISLANSSEVQVSSRANFQTITGSITNGTTVTADITNAYKSYLLFKITTSRGAWVRVYTSKAARTADASRAIDVDPLPGSGVIAEVITTGSTNQTQLLTPATIGFNDEATPVNEIYLTITNRSGTTGAVTVTLTALKLEA